MGITDLLKYIPLLLAAAIIGNWFHSEVKKAKAARAAWYKPYLSIPGVIIVLAVIGLPIIVWLLG